MGICVLGVGFAVVVVDKFLGVLEVTVGCERLRVLYWVNLKYTHTSSAFQFSNSLCTFLLLTSMTFLYFMDIK